MLELSSLSLPESVGQRDFNVPDTHLTPEFTAQYDRQTLWYDAFVYRREVILVCPKLYNFEKLLRGGKIALNGQETPVGRIRRHRRHDTVHLAAPSGATEISVQFGSFSATRALSGVQNDTFAGLNTHVAISRNNALDWIEDFARFHRHHHGLQAMVLFDNASDAYTPGQIEARLKSTGLEKWAVVSVPQAYGPLGQKPHRGDSKFLQPAVLNIARMRFLATARAVLNTDIDELVLPGKRSIFDITRRHPLGFASIPGEWRFPDPQTRLPARHADHRFAKRTGSKPSAKFCISPGGPMGKLSWDVHKPDFISIDKMIRRKDMRFAHCRMVSTNWKANDRHTPVRDLVPDKALCDALDAVFPPKAR